MKTHHHNYDPLTRNHDFAHVSNLTYPTKLCAMLSRRYVVHLNPCNIVYYVESVHSRLYTRVRPHGKGYDMHREFTYLLKVNPRKDKHLAINGHPFPSRAAQPLP